MKLTNFGDPAILWSQPGDPSLKKKYITSNLAQFGSSDSSHKHAPCDLTDQLNLKVAQVFDLVSKLHRIIVEEKAQESGSCGPAYLMSIRHLSRKDLFHFTMLSYCCTKILSLFLLVQCSLTIEASIKRWACSIGTA